MLQFDISSSHMSRKRTYVVAETRADLQQLEHRASGSRLSRLKALRLIMENPEASLDHIGKSVGVSGATMERWWAMYRHEGLGGLLETKQRGGYRRSGVSDDVVNEIHRRRAQGELTTHVDAQQWLLRTHGVSYSLSGIRYLLQRARDQQDKSAKKATTIAKARQNEVPARSSKEQEKEPPRTGSVQRHPMELPESGKQYDQIVRLVTKLPWHHDLVDWVQGLREALKSVLIDVDRISVDVNTRCDLLNPDDYHPDIRIAHDARSDRTEGDVSVTLAARQGSLSAQFLGNLRDRGMPFGEYHSPMTREYLFGGTAYLGCLVFWRDHTRTPISEATIDLIDRLHDFFLFMLSDFVTRFNYARPVDRIFFDILRTISEECHLTPRERQVLTLRLLGESYKVIADRLKISENAVRKHVTSLHKKTGTTSSIQLFAKYFTPRLATVSNPLG